MDHKENQFQRVMESLFQGMNAVLSAKTVVGEPVRIGDDTIVLPLVDISFGVGAGTGDSSQKAKDSSTGGGGLGGKLTPSAVLVIRNGTARLVNIKNQDTVGKVLDMIPDIVDKFTSKKKDDDSGISDKDAMDAAFPDKDAAGKADN